MKKESIQQLLRPITFKNCTIKNRLAVSPMCMYSATDGYASSFHLVHLGARAMGGFGLIMQEATAVAPEGRITYRDLGIWKDAHIEKLQEIVHFVHSHGAKIGIQLAHAGRKASTRPPFEGRGVIPSTEENGWTVVAPSRIPFKEGDPQPHVLTLEEIQKLKTDFLSATKRAQKAGYDCIEIHAAHGYLLHQFLSPISNQREDHYGGDRENRMRLLLEVTADMRREVGKDFPLFVRISATDWVENGWKLEDSIALTQALKKLGVDLIDVSSSGTVPKPAIPVKPGYQVEFAHAIREKAEICTAAVGLITLAEQAAEILEKKQADFIFMGRETLRNPYFVNNLQSAIDINPVWCQQYAWALLPKKKPSIP